MKTDVACAWVLLRKRHLSSTRQMRNIPVICFGCKQWFREKLLAPGQIWGSCHTGHLEVCFAAVVQDNSSHLLICRTAGSYHTLTNTCSKYLPCWSFSRTSKSCETDTLIAGCALALNYFFRVLIFFWISEVYLKEGSREGVTEGEDEQLLYFKRIWNSEPVKKKQKKGGRRVR